MCAARHHSPSAILVHSVLDLVDGRPIPEERCHCMAMRHHAVHAQARGRGAQKGGLSSHLFQLMNNSTRGKSRLLCNRVSQLYLNQLAVLAFRSMVSRLMKDRPRILTFVSPEASPRASSPCLVSFLKTYIFLFELHDCALEL
jgi:hypothetical protein